MAQRNDRGRNGRFVPGNPGGPGRPTGTAIASYLEALTDAVTPTRWAKVIERAVKDAESGDRHAREWLSKYLLGNADIPHEQPTIIDILTDEKFVRWIESNRHQSSPR